MLTSNWDTSSATTMENMFYNCTSLTAIDVSSFIPSNVTNMSGMFRNCTSLESIYATSSFVVTQVTTSGWMFEGDNSLVGGAGTVYDSNHIDKAYAHLDGGTSNPGYLTLKTN